MKILRVTIVLAAVLAASVTVTALAADLGNPTDVKQVRTVVGSKFGKILNVSVSRDWALCTAYSQTDESDLSVVLHRTGTSWKVKQSDGGAFDKTTLKPLGIPDADIVQLLRVYQ
jgi:hypothetical protein